VPYSADVRTGEFRETARIPETPDLPFCLPLTQCSVLGQARDVDCIESRDHHLQQVHESTRSVRQRIDWLRKPLLNLPCFPIITPSRPTIMPPDSAIPLIHGKTNNKLVGKPLLYSVSVFLSIGVWLFG